MQKNYMKNEIEKYIFLIVIVWQNIDHCVHHLPKLYRN